EEFGSVAGVPFQFREFRQRRQRFRVLAGGGGEEFRDERFLIGVERRGLERGGQRGGEGGVEGVRAFGELQHFGGSGLGASGSLDGLAAEVGGVIGGGDDRQQQRQDGGVAGIAERGDEAEDSAGHIGRVRLPKSWRLRKSCIV